MAVQSPIEFNTRNCCPKDDFAPLLFHGHFARDGSASILNTGSSTNVTFADRKVQPFLVGGPLGDAKFIFEQLHFHWADHDSSGCEHTIEGSRYSMEAHAVHYNAKYKSFAEAANKPDGLAVTGFFIQALGDTDCPEFEKVVQGVRRVTKKGDVAALDSGEWEEGKVKRNGEDEEMEVYILITILDCLQWIDQQDLTRHYYTYKGSLTTPPFHESVTWIVYRNPVYVSRRQVALFRDLGGNEAGKKIVNNYRPIQDPSQAPVITFVRNCRVQSKL